MERLALITLCTLLGGAAQASELPTPIRMDGQAPRGAPPVSRGQSVTPPAGALEGARAPAFARDGRLAVSVAGDLWVLHPDGSGGFARAERVTRGSGWDRDPAWTADGDWLVFSSDRAGAFDLWRVRVTGVESADAGTNGAEPERLTRVHDHDVEPTVAPDGQIVFARGRGGDTDLWLRAANGRETRLTSEPGAEREPAWSPDGSRLAYVAVRGTGRELRVRPAGGGSETTIVADRQVRGPSWSPDGERIAWGVLDGRDAGLWTAGADGRLPQAVAAVAGVTTWSPDGVWLVVAPVDGGDGGYNGDPDRLGERLAGDALGVRGQLQRVRAPAWSSPVEVIEPAGVQATVAESNGSTYDRVWARVARLYLGMSGALTPETEARGEESGAARWREVGRRLRRAAVGAADEAALRDAIHAALRERPRRAEAVGRAAVSSASPYATEAGLEVLRRGGNVVDAAVAVSFALGVVEPDASGIGGYGEMLIQLRGMAEPVAIEFMSRVPEAATLTNPAVDAIARSGPGVANVPGTVAGMELAWRRHGSGRVTWAELLEPAIRLAERGHPIGDGFATTLRRERERFEEHASSRALFFRDGQPLATGDTLRNPELAWVLREIARDGAEAFYRGEVGRRMVEDLRRGGNLMTVEDLRRYFAADRRPVRTTYRGNDVYSGPPPVTGGASLLGKLNLLEQVPAGRSMTDEAATLHAMIEATKFQPGTGGRIADPDLWPVDVTPFESKDTAVVRWRCYDARSASAAGALNQRDCGRSATRPDERRMTGRSGGEGALDGAGADAEECLAVDRGCRGTGTTAFVVADAEGNIVSVTQTLGTWGGNFYVSPGLGFLYNDKLRSYGSSPTAYGARLPYARHTTVISPTIVFRGTGAARQPWFGVGAAGNAWITAAVYQMVVGIADHGLGPQAALELPRFLVSGRTVQIEDGFAPAVLRELEAMGHSFVPISLMGELRMGYGAAVVVADGEVRAGGDPRRNGAGGAVW